MSRLSATKTVSRPLPVRARVKKAMPQQDRLTARKLFFRRVRRSVKPGLWLLGGLLGLIVLAQIFQSIPKKLPQTQVNTAPSASAGRGLRHGLAAIAGYAGFRVHDIEINGADTTPLPMIQAALGVKDGDPIFDVPLAAMQSRVEQLGPVQSVNVERILPGTLVVDINERAVYAIWQNNAPGAPANFVLIDRQGDVIANQDAAAAKRRNPSLLLLVGQDAPQNAAGLVNELRAAPAVLARVMAAQRVDGLRWNLTLKNQTLVKLPADNESLAVARLARLQSGMALLDRPVEVIDLRMPGRLIIRPYPAASQPAAANKSAHG